MLESSWLFACFVRVSAAILARLPASVRAAAAAAVASLAAAPPATRPRGVRKYVDDLRSIPRGSHLAIVAFFSLASLYVAIIVLAFPLARNADMDVPVFSLISTCGYLGLHTAVAMVAERRHNKYTWWLLVAIRVLFYMRTFGVVLEIVEYTEDGHSTTDDTLMPLIMQFTVVHFVLMHCVLVPLAFIQPFALTLAELLVGIIRYAIYVAWGLLHDGSTALMPVVGAMLLCVLWTLEYHAMVSYVLEHVLVPDAWADYQAAFTQARGLLQVRRALLF
jgi:hypothetical protein